RVDELDCPGDDASIRIDRDLLSQARPPQGRCGRGVKLIAGEGDPGARAQQIGASIATARLESVRPGDMVLAERGPQIGRREIESVGGDDAALVHRVFGGVAQRYEASV